MPVLIPTGHSLIRSYGVRQLHFCKVTLRPACQRCWIWIPLLWRGRFAVEPPRFADWASTLASGSGLYGAMLATLMCTCSLAARSSTFAVYSPPPAEHPSGGIHRVAAVRCSGDGYRSSAVNPNRGHVPSSNHFLVGTSTNAVVDVSEATGLSEIGAERSAVRAAMRVGWVLKHTTRAGDCGIDVMAYHARRARVSSTWKLFGRSWQTSCRTSRVIPIGSIRSWRARSHSSVGIPGHD